MKITKIANRWYDENNNSWDTEEAATLYSPTLTNCYNCSNCSNCSVCSDCSNWCSNCNDCDSCRDCINCNNCGSCSSCSNCRSCCRCSDCDNCKFIASLFDRVEVDASLIESCKENLVREEFDLNNRKLEIEL